MADNFAALSEGTIVRDALEPALEAGVTLNAAGTDNGTVIDCMRLMDARIELKTSTVASTGNTATLSVEIKAANTSDFSDTVVSLGRFSALSGTDAVQTGVTRYLDVYTQKRYLRATAVVGGTAPDYSGTTIRVVPERYQVQDNDSA